MAVTAVCTLNKGACFPEQTVTVTCTVTNSGTSALIVNQINPIATPLGGTTQTTGGQLGVPLIGGAYPNSLPASGTFTVSWGFTPHGPNTTLPIAEPSQLIYSLGAEILTSDGSDTFAVSAPLNVIAPVPVPLVFGQLNFSFITNSALAL